MNNDPRYNTGDCLKDTWRYFCDASFAILPRDIAHQLGEFEKNVWGGVRCFAEKNLGWIDEALTGGDRLREEWQRRHETNATTGDTTATGAAEPGTI
ncbi:MAG: hypothetical protein QOF61_402 [Acidobacteriota bacterium]|jgi:hypothetical protein|nr:hypothetical protein [Acidobacteriota bacterium]